MRTGATSGQSPSGFSGALVPYFRAKGQPWLEELQDQRARGAIDQWIAGTGPAPFYYDYMLSLFGLGWADKYYRFAADGRLLPLWESSCSATAR